MGDRIKSGDELIIQEVLTENHVNKNKLSKSDIVHPLSNTGSSSVNLISFKEWRNVIKQHFPSLVFAAEAGLSLFAQLHIKDIRNPFALTVVDVPSSGKTICLNFFSRDIQAYSTDAFTPASFVSQASNVKKEKLGEVDLLPRIRGKVLIVRDLAPLFGQRDDDLLKNMAVMTRVLDGEGLELDGGVHGKRGYTGDYLFMFLAASTPISPRIFKTMGNLGPRLFFLSIDSKTKSEESLVDQLVNTSWKEKEDICRKITQDYLDSIRQKYPKGIDWDKKNDSKECLSIIARCAMLLSRLRAPINIWREEIGDTEKYSYQSPIIEKPDRINQLLYNLARGHALISGRTNINTDDLRLIVNICFDSAPLNRSKLFRLFINSGGVLTTTQISERLNYSRPAVLKDMESFKVLGIADLFEEHTSDPGRPEKTMRLKSEFIWFLSPECTTYLLTDTELSYIDEANGQ